MTHEGVTNLFANLSRYTLKPENLPLENFCTELLAWCLNNSPKFQRQFLNLIRLDYLRDFEGEIEVLTQQRYMSDEEEQGQLSIFDLVIQPTPKSITKKSFFLAIESKIGADFENGQLKKYRQELANKRENFDNSSLLTLTKHPEKPELADAHIQWSLVQEALAGITVENTYLQIIYRQFADFLELRGMKPMRVEKTNPETLASHLEGMEFRKELEDILLNLVREHEELKLQFRQKKVEFEPQPDGSYCLGIFGGDRRRLWVGFWFRPRAGKTIDFFMSVCMEFDGCVPESDVRMAPELTGNLRRDEAYGQTFFNFDQLIDSKYDGNANAMFDWLKRTSSAVQKMERISKP